MIAPNTLLQNRYLVVNQVGQGGMGAVYIATDQRFGSMVALKETFFTDASMRKAFEREARLLNHLRHGALPKVIDHFAEEDGQFLVMEFIPGDDLSEMLKGRGDAFPVSKVLDWADELLDALDYLHTQEPPVIHRDIKPQNLKITTRGHIVLLDFGLAKGAPVQLSRVTNTGSIFGYSRNYAPIEQIQGAGTDVRSDLYSLGATLYHLITGVTPPDALTRATAVLNHQPDPLQLANELNPQVPRAIAQVIHRAMAQSAAQRPQTAADMRVEMRQAAAQAERAQTASSGALPTVVNEFSEQNTQILGAGVPATQAIANEPARETKTGGAETERMSEPEVSPLMAAPSKQATASPERASATSLDSAAELTVPGEEASVATKVRAQPTALTQTPSSRRAFLIAAGILLLLAGGAAVYMAMRSSRAQNASQATQAQPQPSTPGTQTTPSPTPPAQSEASATTEPTVAPAQTAGHPAEGSTSRIVNHPAEHRTQTHEENAQPAPTVNNSKSATAARPPQPPQPVDTPSDIPPRNDPGYWEARRQAAEQRRQEMQNRRMMRMERQIIQQQQQREQRRRMGRP